MYIKISTGHGIYSNHPFRDTKDRTLMNKS